MKTSEKLIKGYKAQFDAATNHQFITDLFKGTLADDSLYIYLTQDEKYFYLYLKVILKTAFLCGDEGKTLRYGKQIGFISNDENDYFDKTVSILKERDGSLSKKFDPKKFEPKEVTDYIKFLHNITDKLSDYSFNQMVTYLWTTEVVYLTWGEKPLANPQLVSPNLPWIYKEWIRLHNAPIFQDYVAFLQKQVDNIEDIEEVRPIFEKTVDLELGFFEGCYRHL